MIPFDHLDVAHKRVLLRVDLNVPLKDGQVLDDFRLKAILPTIKDLHKRGATIILATHLGRPTPFLLASGAQEATQSNSELSTRNLIPWFKQHNITVNFESKLMKSSTLPNQGAIILLENLRFYEGEQKSSSSNSRTIFAQTLKSWGDCYVNDAFATLHRNDTSVVLAALFKSNQRAVGPLITAELAALDKLINNPQQPFVAVLAGGKPADKIPLIQGLLQHVSTLLIGPALSLPFAQAQGLKTGATKIDDATVSAAERIIKIAEKKQVTLIVPKDYLIAYDTLEGNLDVKPANELPANSFCMSIGPQTVEMYCKELAAARTIFYNAAMGFPSRPETLEPSKILLQAVAKTNAYSVVGGGDSVMQTNLFGLNHNVSHLSTGGGATLAYLAGSCLPGLESFDMHSAQCTGQKPNK